MQGELLQWLTIYVQRGWLYSKHVVLTFQVMWYQSEIEYLDKRITKLERELVD